MDFGAFLLAAQEGGGGLGDWTLYIIGGAVFALFAVVVALVLFMYGGIWFQAYMSNANVSLLSLVGMTRRA